MTTPRPDSRLGTTLGPYRIEAVIGRGGMGVVYLAEQARLGRKVALKIVAPEFADDPRSRARFIRESQMASAIDHPNILPIYEADEADGVLFIAMRLVEGTDLATRLHEGALAPREAVSILAHTAAALDAAHARGLIHRDVKPANILIAPGAGSDQGDHVYLTDFGLTKRGGSESSLTAVGAFAGTLAYIAPEQVEGREVDGRADQYSLACMAFECLTGKVPYERDTDIAVAMAHIRDDPPSAVALRPELPTAMDAVLARGMAKSPADRYPSCSALVAALRGALAISDTRPGPAIPVLIDAGRARKLVAAAAAIVVLIAAAVWFGNASGAPTPSSSATPNEAAVSSPSPTEDVFPNAAESALLARLPATMVDDCSRGPYDLVKGDSGPATTGTRGGKTPTASIICALPATSGANVLIIRSFEYGYVGNVGFTTEQAVSGVATTVRAPGGDCATSHRANGRWERAGENVGAILCYADSTSGDAILYWSYAADRILVKAINQRGDADALYGFFDDTARFIAP